MSDTIIQVSNLSKIYKVYDKPIDRLKESLNLGRKSYHKDFNALTDVSFDVHRGEIYGIMGQNGSGKSTLLKIITGVLSASSGKIAINGKISALLELGAGFNFEYTGIQNIYLNGAMLGFTKEEIANKVDSIIEFADIGDFVNQPVKTYSSGMFARLAFAVAINVDPDILIVDEALSVGDFFFQAKCYKKFEEFKSKGKTILFVSHDMSSILKYCDRVLLLNHGKTISEGSADHILNIYKKLLVNQYKDEAIEETKLQEQLLDNDDDLFCKNRLTINPFVLDYGSKEAEIIDFAIKDKTGMVTNSILKSEQFEIYMKIKFNKKILAPIFAFTIKDIKGTELMGTNTLLENKTIENINDNEIIEISFKQEMNLQGSTYLLSLGCTGYSGNEFVVYHRLYDVCNITVVSQKNTIGYYDCNSDIEIKRMIQ
ncbi:Wzt carbohydrate-binding domain-containing protein [Gorillibacterium massiliense]|uniref:Wzt carbohydrate-binding domain-containing protein n=1 Tax=Gorillibacterium massiliense TaxID=1280390 RepID=UPI0004B5D8C5